MSKIEYIYKELGLGKFSILKYKHDFFLATFKYKQQTYKQ